MIVSFLCPTSGRLPDERHLLEEKLYWFTQMQKFRPSSHHELVILNDCKEQTLKTDVPGVRIINYPIRFSSIGDKMNALQVLAKGDILLVDEDDDVSLPRRAIQAELELAKCGGGYWEPFGRWYQPGKQAPIVPDYANCKHHASAYLRNSVVYPSETKGHDWTMSQMYGSKERKTVKIDPMQLHYIYRWGVSKNHLSGNHDMVDAYHREGLRQVEPGTFTLEPKMQRDYHVEVADAIRARLG